MSNPFCHIELTTSNVGGAVEFYKAIFDWKITGATGMDYELIDTGKQPGGGIMAKPSEHVPTAWTVYVQVDSIEDILVKVVDAGGKIHYPRTEIPQIGWFAIIADPQGGVIGLFETFKE